MAKAIKFTATKKNNKGRILVSKIKTKKKKVLIRKKNV